MIPKIKICGITKIEEAEYLNETGVEYAGLVFYEKSRRNVTFTQAKELLKRLDSQIERVAVTVSPDRELVQRIEEAGFTILQVHGAIDTDSISDCGLPIWRALNISKVQDVMEQLEREQAFENPLYTGFVADGMSYGGGKAFSWKDEETNTRIIQKLRQKTFILAGGLQSENVAEGIRIFHPDVVDVSSGVEGLNGKSKEKIETFVRKVRKHG